MASFNIGQTPMPTNAGPKPFIKPVAVGYFEGNLPAATNSIAGYDNQQTNVSGNAAAASAPEGKRVYAVFKFTDSATGSAPTQLLDSAALTYSFDGISADDWVPGTFKVATVASGGTTLSSDVESDWYDAGYTTGTVATAGWASVSSDINASSGTIYYKDLFAFDPLKGTDVYGVVLSVQLKNDALVETGEHVKFKITQDSASGTAFTQSNYTEANIKVADNLGDFSSTPNTAGGSFTVNATTGVPTLTIALPTASGVSKDLGTANVTDVFTVTSSAWTATGVTFTNINNFGAGQEDVLRIDYTSALTSAPGLSLVNFGDVSGGFTNEAYLLTALRSLDGFDMNNSGIYMMQVKDAADSTPLTVPNDLLAAAGTSSTYILVDSNRNGKVDTGAGDADLLIKLTGVAVNDLQSVNFQLVA